MTVRLRMSIHGKRNNRIFHMVAIDLRKRRDAKPIETLGIYQPALKHGDREKRIEWSVERIRYWLSMGAQPSKTFERLLNLGGITARPSDIQTF
ncbi:ribosomal protein S16 [Ramaria rubella]|nr:ribosomal protein S16 [Ramaria rubella]